jgi:hypothetical protein
VRLRNRNNTLLNNRENLNQGTDWEPIKADGWGLLLTKAAQKSSQIRKSNRKAFTAATDSIAALEAFSLKHGFNDCFIQQQHPCRALTTRGSRCMIM